MDFGPTICPVEVVKKVLLVVLILETFTLVLLVYFIKIVGKYLKS